MFKRRYALYALLIVVAVGSGLAILSRESAKDGGRRYGVYAAPPPQKPWAPTAELDTAANESFGLEASRPVNVRLAGKEAGADWPQFNGHSRDNRSLEIDLLPSWPKAGPPVAWIAKGVGDGFSSVAVVKGVVYTMGNKGPVEAIIALDAGTGQKIWSTPISWASTPSMGAGPRSTPTVSAGSVFGLGGSGDLASVDVATGKLRWRKNILKEFEGAYPGWGMCESVLVDQNRLICTPGGKTATLAALNPDTGDVIWKSVVPDKDTAGYASSGVADVGGVRQYVQFTAMGTVGVRADDGHFLWRENSAANGTANCSSPLVAGDLVFSSSNYGTGGSLVRLSPKGQKIEAQLVYHTANMKVHHGDMVIVDGLLYGSNDPGILTCLDLPTGKVKWQSREVGKGSITYADGRLYCRAERGTVTLIEATGTKFHELGRFEPSDRSSQPAWSHPVVAEGKLFLRDEDRLFCYDLKKSK